MTCQKRYQITFFYQVAVIVPTYRTGGLTDRFLFVKMPIRFVCFSFVSLFVYQFLRCWHC